MQPLTRRGFIKSTSVGLAAVGALGAMLPLPTFAQAGGMPATPAQPSHGPMPLPHVPLTGGAPFMVYISDPTSGAGTILVGEQAIPFTNGAVVQALRNVIG